MDTTGVLLSWLLGIAVLVPLASFVLILLFGPSMGKGGRQAGMCATGAILTSCLLSLIALGIWASKHTPLAESHHGGHAAVEHQGAGGGDHDGVTHSESAGHGAVGHGAVGHGAVRDESPSYSYEVYTLGKFVDGRLTISLYIDALTICMFVMVTLISTCIHFYAIGYMHDELVDDYIDHEVTLSDGSHLHRPGRFHRFFQALSLFCFSMLGLVLSGNVVMTFVFWELVGICSYFLIGFYVERPSASTAANKAFIVNRIGDFGMIIGLMALWGSLGTFSFGGDDGIFAQVRPGPTHELRVPDGMVKAAAGDQVAQVVRSLGPAATAKEASAAIESQIPTWRAAMEPGEPGRGGRWLLIVAGIGIFCGCIGKSAQFPLHVWLPDAMEGPTPVSALVHSATMVAAGVFLVARFYPVFTPEVLLVIAIVGTITLFLAATIAIVATDIKRVLAYSTISQLGYMMLALGVGGWLAGVMHLFTHAFFKSLLFMCSGSVIHAVHTNEMSEMGGLRKKMPWTASTMLIGCLAIAGAGLPFTLTLWGVEFGLGFSGFYSKDAILEQALSFRNENSGWGTLFFAAAAGGAAITAFYMFRLWFLTFAGEPRDQKRYDHAHESPPVMYRPLILLAVLAITVAWGPIQAIVGSLLALIFFAILKIRSTRVGGSRASHGEDGPNEHGPNTHSHPVSHNPLGTAVAISGLVLVIGLVWLPFSGEWRTIRGDDTSVGYNLTLAGLLEQGRPVGTLPTQQAALLSMTWPDEHLSHAPSIKIPATWIAFSTALGGILLATVFYGVRRLDAAEAQRSFAPIHRFLLKKWWFDELYQFLFVKPVLTVSQWISQFDLRVVDRFLDGSVWCVRVFSGYLDRFADRGIVDGSANAIGDLTYRTGLSLRRIQTGNLRQYVMFIVIGTVVVFAIASFWRHAMAF